LLVANRVFDRQRVERELLGEHAGILRRRIADIDPQDIALARHDVADVRQRDILAHLRIVSLEGDADHRRLPSSKRRRLRGV